MKEKSIILKTRRPSTVDEKVGLRTLIYADTERQEYIKGPTKKSVATICTDHGIHFTTYFQWTKECCLFYSKIGDYITGGVDVMSRIAQRKHVISVLRGHSCCG